MPPGPAAGGSHSLDFVAAAQYNTVHLWEAITLDEALPEAAKHNIQVIYHMGDAEP